MEAVIEVVAGAFYAATLASLAFFLHKVLWLVHYKKIQGALIDASVAELDRESAAGIVAWGEFTRGCWKNALGGVEVEDASDFAARVEASLAGLRGDMTSTRRSLEELLGNALTTRAPDGKPTVLSLRRIVGPNPEARAEVHMDLSFATGSPPRPPDRSLYALKSRSRYGFFRRALVFFSGAADVVYSSHHVALMSQNVHVPTSVLVRRLSLVFLLLAVVVVDIVFGVKRWLAGLLDVWLPAPAAARAGSEGDFFAHHLGPILAFGLWMAAYGALYLVLYFLIRRRYQASVRRLKEMAGGEAAALKAIYRRHLGDLVRWGRAYGRSLDGVVEVTLRHAETLIDHDIHSLRRRLANPALLAQAKTIADSLFLRLPESRGELQDVATLQKHSLRHYLWPRAEEMGYQARFARYRAAWQHLESAGSELRSEQPSPTKAHELWQSAVTYATVFAPLVPAGAADALRQAYAQMVTECVMETDDDLAALDRRLSELTRSLTEQLASARSLCVSKVALCNQAVQGAAAARTAEIIQLREQARLEAMAFEI
jgi:hypothetical protein